MPRLEERDQTYFTTVRGMCRECRSVVPARVFFREDGVWQQSLCPTCKTEPALIATDRNWYLAETLRPRPDHAPLAASHAPRLGCPRDCGPCTWHASPCQLPVISVTNACDMRCPICFTYNRPDREYHMPVEELRRTLDSVVEAAGGLDLVNITGGEPTRHPDILALLDACRRPGIGRVTMNSNGLRLAGDADLCRRLAELDVHVVLSFHTLDPATSRRIHGCDVVDAKRRAVANLGEAGARMTLLHVMIRDVNDGETGDIVRFAKSHPHVLSLTVQTMTYTGQGGGQFLRTRHLPVDECARHIAAQMGGGVAFEDFLPRPSAHPLCYLQSYFLRCGDEWVPFTRFASRETLERLTGDSYLLRPAESDALFRDLIDQAFVRGETQHLRALRAMVEALYPPGQALDPEERRRRAEDFVRTVRIHAHMDEDTFDASRAMLCPDLVPAEPGRLMPACTYNLFYRMQDPRFYEEPT